MITLEQFQNTCHEFGFILKDNGLTIDINPGDHVYSRPGYLVARFQNDNAITIWMRQNDSSEELPDFKYKVYVKYNELMTMGNNLEVINELSDFREHLQHFVNCLKNTKKLLRVKLIDEL